MIGSVLTLPGKPVLGARLVMVGMGNPTGFPETIAGAVTRPESGPLTRPERRPLYLPTKPAVRLGGTLRAFARTMRMAAPVIQEIGDKPSQALTGHVHDSASYRRCQFQSRRVFCGRLRGLAGRLFPTKPLFLLG